LSSPLLPLLEAAGVASGQTHNRQEKMGEIALIKKVRIKEMGLPTSSGFCLHDRPQKCSGATGFL